MLLLSHRIVRPLRTSCFTGLKYMGTASNEEVKCEKPLAGVRVLDLSRIVMGPFCTMTLGDLGAEVIKVERPVVGDETRRWGVPVTGGETSYFLSINRNKKSICIDFKSTEGRKVLLDLVSASDVLVENYVPGKLDALDLGYDKIQKTNPSLIYVSLTGYGPNGPYASRPGYDVIAASVGGLLHITGPENGEPCKIGVPMTDIAAGLYAHGAILAALFNRLKTGKGVKIDVNLLSTQVACLATAASAWLNAGEEAKRRGSSHDWIVPYEALEAKCGGRITIGAGSNAQFSSLCSLIGLNHLIDDPKYKTNVLRVANRDTLIGEIRSRFKEKTVEEWLKILDGAPFPYGPVNTIPQVFENPQVKHLGLVKSLNHPKVGNLRIVGPPVQYSNLSNEVHSTPPLLGEHTVDVLQNVLKYSRERVDSLFEMKAVS
ncbi:succinate--hydroxymethylglutarate CoA-transferase-like isoform X1 [Ischnura elegans]|uniref:succinate--hydroxymethylglutarate CoA-transferase-like isoform X1 n=1 Tax=Ischnura elegans TaxID=197161 RepID=UPI001ED88503|nr:succinate--hydroxymethylglutarate CoA-transferase-like isoform X1 [Ischnura elegans]